VSRAERGTNGVPPDGDIGVCIWLCAGKSGGSNSTCLFPVGSENLLVRTISREVYRYQFSVFSFQFSVLSFQFSVFGCRFVSCQLISYTRIIMIRDVTDLEVYTLSLELLTPLYRLTHLLPSEHRKIKYQANEAAEKIPPQIAEGFAKKRSPKEFCRFLSMALGSSDEVITHI